MSGTVKRLSIATAVAACIGVATLPSAASAGPVEDLVGGVQKTVDDTLNSVGGLLNGGGGGGSAAPSAEPTPQADGGTTEPGLDGTNPHGQGEGLDLSSDLPLVEDVVGTVIVGQSRGEQDGDGNYHGNVTVLSVSGLGLDISVPTDEGQTETGPLGAVNDALDDVCIGSGICLNLLDFRSETTDGGSENGFSVVRANILDGLVEASAIESKGCIQEEEVTAEGDEVGGETEDQCEAPADGCQKAEGYSRVAGAGALSGALDADVIRSESESVACNDGTESATADSEVVELSALELDLGDLLETGVIGCETGDTVDDPFVVAAILDVIFADILIDVLSGVCNGDDTNGGQADSPYNVRKGLGADALALLEEVLGGSASLDVSTSESLAVAPCPDPTDASDPDCPPIDECPDPTDTSDPDCPPIDECPDPTDASDPDCPDNPDDCPDPTDQSDPDCPDTTVATGGPPSADTPDESLPFTGADIGTLGVIGLGVMAIGLALMALSDRRRGAVQS